MDKSVITVERNPALPPVRRSSGDRRHIVAIIVLITLSFLCGCERDVLVPQEVIGEWKTAAPGYADRYLKFTTDALIYGIGNDEEMAHRIKKIDAKQLGKSTLYTFYYTDAEGDNAFLSFTYEPDGDGALKIKNDGKIWKKADP